MKVSGSRFLLAVAFAWGLGLLASSAASAYCRVCGLGGCYDVGKGETGYTYCDMTNGYCRQKYWGCTGKGACNEVDTSGCIDYDNWGSMTAPHATMVLTAGERGGEPFDLVALARRDAAATAMCPAIVRPSGLNEVVIQ